MLGNPNGVRLGGSYLQRAKSGLMLGYLHQWAHRGAEKRGVGIAGEGPGEAQ